MDSNQFDRLTRLAGTRRSVGLALGAATLLGLAEAATAKKKKKRCKKTRKGTRCDGTTCGRFSIKTCHSIKDARCRCRAGTTCLLENDSCGLSCVPDCPVGCFCADGDEQVCLTTAFLCEETPLCSATADCPLGTACTVTRCGGPDAMEKHCVPLCDQVP